MTLSNALKIRLTLAQRALEAAREQDATNPKLEAHRKDGFFFLPVTKRIVGVKGIYVKADFEERKEKGSLRELAGKYGLDAASINRSFDLVGSIAIIEDQGKKNNERLAKAIMELHPRAKTVATKGTTSGPYRIRKLKTIAGTDTALTTIVENNCTFLVELNKAYFSSRLSFERERIVSLVKDNEKILVLFAGVGPFPIVIAKRRKVEMAAIEYNPDAVKLMKENAKRNKTAFYIECADAGEFLARKKWRGWADRILMPAPHNAHEFLPAAINAAKKGARVHFYSFVSPKDGEKEIKRIVKEACASQKRRCRVTLARQVSSFSAGKAQWVADFQVY